MLSAVETFGPASAVVQHPYGQIHHIGHGHHPSMHNHPFGLNRSGGLFLPPPIPPQHSSTTSSLTASLTAAATTSTSLPIQISPAASNSFKESNTQLSLSSRHTNETPPQPQDTSMSTLVTTSTTTRSPTLSSPLSSSSSCSSSSSSSVSSASSSASLSSTSSASSSSSCSSTPTTPSSTTAVEFARPHPKQPRYSNGSNCNGNGNTNNDIISPSSQYSPRSANTGKYVCNNNNNISSINHNHNHSQSKYAVSEQTGPVNLVTSNNSHSEEEHHSSHSMKSEIDDSVVSLNGIYSQKLPFTVTNGITSGHPPPPSAAYHSYIYANRPIPYGQSPMYPTHTHGRSPIQNRLIFLHEPAYSTPYMTTQLNPSQHSHSSHSLPPTPTELSPPPPLLLHPPPTPTQSPLDRSRNPAASNLQMGSSVSSGGGSVMNGLEVMNGNGTYLNGKVSNQMPTDTTSGGFKVPSGKEGSLKHRILTTSNSSINSSSNTSRPNNTIDGHRKNSMRANLGNFAKGSVIELANGGLRRVEDMRTEDFIHSAEKSPYHKLADSTIVKITKTSTDTIIITFSYCKNQSKADVEVTEEHPFFVYGNGWASYNPELSMESFGLKCQKLQVGDVCISLTMREQPLQQQPQLPQPGSYEVPQNLSKKGLQLPTTTASGSLFFSNKRTYSGNNTQKQHWSNEQEIVVDEPVDVSLGRKRKWSDSDYCTNSSS